MTVAQWIRKNKSMYMFDELTIVYKDNHIILDDRIAYLDSRDEHYTKNWKARCRGKQIIEEKSVHKAIVLVIE